MSCAKKVINCDTKPKIKVCDDVYNVLMQFAARCQEDRPDDIVLYAIQHFTQIRNKRKKLLVRKLLTQKVIVEADLAKTTVIQEIKKIAPESVRVRHGKVRSESYDLQEMTKDEGAETKTQFPKDIRLKILIGGAVLRSSLFESLSKELLIEVIEAMEPLKAHKGECILRQGEVNNQFCVIQYGALELLKTSPDMTTPMLVRTCKNDDYYGELSLLYDVVNEFSVYPMMTTLLWTIGRQKFRYLLLKSACSQRKRRENVLATIPLLKNLKREERERLAEAMKPKICERGSYVYCQGDVADGVYIIDRGTASLNLRGLENRRIEINVIGKDRFFGELSLISFKLRPITVLAQEKLRLQFLGTDVFESILGPCLKIMQRSTRYKVDLARMFGAGVAVDQLRKAYYKHSSPLQKHRHATKQNETELAISL